MKWHHWTIFGFGVWLMASPWILGFSKINLAAWNNVIVGLLAIILVLWNMEPPEE